MKRSILAMIFAASFLHALGTPNVTLSGVLQGPNGLPVANSTISLTPTQPFYVAGNGPFCSGYIFQINGLILNCSDTININSLVPAAPTNGVNIIWNYSHATGKDSVSAALVGDGNAAHCLSGIGTNVTCSG